MTTKPKAKKFRIRRSTPTAKSPEAETAAPAEAKEALVAPPQATSNPGSTSIDAIRKEGLTGRQLRLARRIAQKQGLAPTSDFDAVRLLREMGIDPFARANILELVDPETGETPPTAPQNQVGKIDPIQLPQTVPAGKGVPSTEVSPADRRAAEIIQIQQDIARRRRRKLALLMTRLAVFVGLPTLIMGYYFYVLATPLYATKTEFIIQQADSGNSGGGLGGLFAGTGAATLTDGAAVQNYLGSRDAMLRLDADMGFRAHFSEDNIDTIRRLPEDASNEDTYSLYQDMVRLGYDPAEGIVRMEVIAADPQVSEGFSKALLGYAEERVDNLTQRLRADQMAGATAAFEDAENKRAEALDLLVALQIDLQLVSPEGETSNLQSQITQLETQLIEKELQLQALLDNARPNAARVEGTQADIRRLNEAITGLRGRLTSGNAEGEVSQATKNAQLRAAEEDYQTRNLMLQQAAQQLETARIEADRQVRFLSASVPPVAPDEPTYPRAFENTILTFLIFSGIYLMVSLTASILREQVSS